MAQKVSSYNPKDIIIIFGEDEFEGKGEDVFCEITYNTDIANMVAGVDGEVTVNLTNDETAQITLTAKPSSNFNDALSAAANALIAGAPGAFKRFQLVNAASGRTLFTASNAFVGKITDVSFGQAQAENAWMIKCPHLKGTVGGSNQVS